MMEGGREVRTNTVHVYSSVGISGADCKKLISLQVSPTCQVVMAGGPQVHTDHLAHLTFLNIPLRRCINTARLTEGSGVFILDIRPADFGQF